MEVTRGALFDHVFPFSRQMVRGRRERAPPFYVIVLGLGLRKLSSAGEDMARVRFLFLLLRQHRYSDLAEHRGKAKDRWERIRCRE
jgi:hypothetical protein